MLLGVDVGGTFTDAVLLDGDANVHTAKVPSTPSEQSLAVLEAVRAVLELAGARAQDVERFAHGMTVATNALLEGRTARTALLATAGFTDVIELARQNRPRLYELCRGAPAPLVPAQLRFAVPERMGPDGPLLALDPALAARARQPARGQRAGRGCGLAAALLRRPRPRAAAGDAPGRARATGPTCRCHASSLARFASTSAPPRPSSTLRSRPCSPPTWASSPRTLTRSACASRRSCSPPAASPTPPVRARTRR